MGEPEGDQAGAAADGRRAGEGSAGGPPPGSGRAALAARFDAACGGRSGRAVARLLGVSHESVRRYRSGEAPIPAEVAARACTLLKVSPQWLLLGEIPPEGLHRARRLER